jgi:ATP-dependent exoDNAse (exonuclease V) alpha subunit
MFQSTALKILNQGNNVFLTGAAGSGKTYVLNQFIKEKQSQNIAVAVTGSTGIAASHLDGVTIHSFTGINVFKHLPSDFYDNLKSTKKKNLKKCQILIIDEISMLPAYCLDMIDEVFKTIKHSSRPFGGVQVVLTGDFFQLPPVVNRNFRPFNADQSEEDGENLNQGFAYSSKSFQDAEFKVCYLTEQHRQSNARFNELLNHIREQQVTQSDIDLIKSRINAELDKEYTKLSSRNDEADTYNNVKLNEINEKSKTFKMTTMGSAENIKTLKRSSLAVENLELKKSALVMAIKNDQNGKYINGSIGTVIDFVTASNGTVMPKVEFENGATEIIPTAQFAMTNGFDTIAYLEQIPLRLAYAITIHKSQGMTLDGAILELGRLFTPGQGYVALSRVIDYNNLSITTVNKNIFSINSEAFQKDVEFRSLSKALE